MPLCTNSTASKPTRGHHVRARGLIAARQLSAHRTDTYPDGLQSSVTSRSQMRYEVRCATRTATAWEILPGGD